MTIWKLCVRLAITVGLVVSLIGVAPGGARAVICCGGGGGGGGGSSQLTLFVYVQPAQGSVQISGGGVTTVNYTNNSEAYLSVNTTYTIQAYPSPMYQFSSWSATYLTLGAKTAYKTTFHTSWNVASLTLNLVPGGYFNVTVHVTPADGSVAIIGPGVNTSAYTNGKVAHLYAAGRYSIQALPGTNYSFSKWGGENVIFASQTQALTNITAKDSWRTLTGQLNLTLKKSPWLNVSFFVSTRPGAANRILVWDSLYNTTQNFTNGSFTYLPVGIPMLLTADLSPSWQFDQWYAPNEQIGNPIAQSTTIAFPSTTPASVDLIASLNGANAPTGNWSGYKATYSAVDLASANFTVPFVQLNSSFPSGEDYVGEEALQGIAIGGTGSGTAQVEGGIGEYVFVPNGTEYAFVFANEFTNNSPPGDSWGTYSELDCFYPSWVYNSIEQQKILPPLGCSDGGLYGTNMIPGTGPYSGQTVSITLSWSTQNNIPVVRWLISWSGGDVSQYALLGGNDQRGEIVAPNPSGQVAWFLEVGPNPWSYSCVYGGLNYGPDCIGAPTFISRSVVSNPLVQVVANSNNVTVKNLESAPLTQLTGEWSAPVGPANNTTFPVTSISTSGSFSFPTEGLQLCATCQTPQAIHISPEQATSTFEEGWFAQRGWSGGSSAQYTLGPTVSLDGTVDVGIQSQATDISAAELWAEDGLNWSDVTVPISGVYDVAFQWSVDATAGDLTSACSPWPGVPGFFGSAWASGYVDLVGYLNESSSKGPQLGSSSVTLVSAVGECGLDGPADSVSGTIFSVVLTVGLQANVDYFPSSFLALNSLSASSGLPFASDYSFASTQMEGIELIPLYVA